MPKRSLRHWLPVIAVAAVFAAVTALVGFQTVSADSTDNLPAPPERGSMGITTGPDVTIIELPATRNWGVSGGTRGYSLATNSCNIGSEPSNWCDDFPGCGSLTPAEHPVIAQNLYRYDADNGRFEQIGMSWLKHGFLSLNTFDPNCQGNDGTGNPTNCVNPPLGGDQLGVGCTDLYGTFLNGSRPLGLRSEVNPTAGTFPFPNTTVTSPTVIDQRMQVAEADLSVANARYFIEGHYVVDNDAQAGNGLNNTSYRETFVGAGFDLDLFTMVPTVRELSAIFAWQAIDPVVEIVNVDVPSNVVERFHAARRVTDLGGGQWHYEYAIHNMNSDRSARSFAVDFGGTTVITGVGFHDVDHHSGEPYATTDWTPAIDGGAGTVTWSTDTFATDANANALRWGTMFSFWFDADRGPTGVNHTLGLFKPGSPTTMNVPFAGGGPGNAIFSDGFETGDTSLWSSTQP